VRGVVCAVLALIALAGLGAARAAELTGSDGPDRLRGTSAADAILGRGGNDRIEGRGGSDFLHGGGGRDVLAGDAGNDVVAVHADRARDRVSCGPGVDLVNAELADAVESDCEVVSRQLSRDPFRVFPAQYETQVEPDSFAFGSTIVTAFQSSRLVDGGAQAIGWASSSDSGRTWRAGFLPSVGDRVSDPVVAYDAIHRVWLIAALGAEADSVGLLVSRSPDARTWTAPEPAAADPAEHYDKEWLTCDSWPRSPFRGRCYLSYLEGETLEVRTRRSTDGGRTWSAPVGVRVESNPLSTPNGALPIVRPDGTLLVPFTVLGSVSEPDSDAIAVARSTDGGATFEPVRRIAPLHEEPIPGVRSPPFVSADVDASGTVYIAWADCRFSADCDVNGIVLASSADGIAWTTPRRVPFGASGARVDRFVPGLAVDRGTAGRQARLAIAAYSVTKAEGCRDCELVDALLVQSGDGGRTWAAPRRLNAESMPLAWLAQTGLGRMLGDYISTSFVGGRPIPILCLAAEPELGEFRQAIFATTTLPR
jgi:hypothetical protein